MKKINPFKAVWDQDDWFIYINNLELLCEDAGILKREFNKRVDMVNAFRKDAHKPSQETFDKIAAAFGKDVDWLFTYHDKLTPEVKQPEKDYDPHGGYKPDPEKALGVMRGTPQWLAFDYLSKIYDSKDQELIEAAYRNLKTFADLVERMSKKHEPD